MSVNLNQPHLWNDDVRQSVDLYNDWFMSFAPLTYRETRVRTTESVETALQLTRNLTDITPTVLREHPKVLPMLRMATAPPLARDRLVGLAGVSKNLVLNMEDSSNPRLPPRMTGINIDEQLSRIGNVIERLADRGILPWLENLHTPTEDEVHRAATIVADRLCGSMADPLIRNAQEAVMLQKLQVWLEARGYSQAVPGTRFDALVPGTFAFRLNVEGEHDNGNTMNIPIDTVIFPLAAQSGQLPLLVEAKSAGDYTNPNKRRKEEADKVGNLRRRHGRDVQFILYLRGYFDSGYLGYEAASGIDWLWEHRIDDLASFGV